MSPGRRRLFPTCGLALLVTPALVEPSRAQVHHVAELTAPELARLDRARTVVVIPGGILEEHGPYLPSYSDGYLNERLAAALASHLAGIQRPAVLFPSIPLGNSGANDIGARFVSPGTYSVRGTTLRAVFLDVADQLGLQGFQTIFVVHLHGAPLHNRVLDQAGDYFAATYGGGMIHLTGQTAVLGALAAPKTPADSAADGLPIHAGMDETSVLLYLRPDLVRPGYRRAPCLSGPTMDSLIALARRADWPGYFGCPARATAARGRQIFRALRQALLTAAGRELSGKSAGAERFGDMMLRSPPDLMLDSGSVRDEQARAARQEQWLRARSLEEGSP